MAPGRVRDERKEQQWPRWINQCRANELSVRTFCTRHGLALADRKLPVSFLAADIGCIGRTLNSPAPVHETAPRSREAGPSDGQCLDRARACGLRLTILE
jgi:hypothetical protein